MSEEERRACCIAGPCCQLVAKRIDALTEELTVAAGLPEAEARKAAEHLFSKFRFASL